MASKVLSTAKPRDEERDDRVSTETRVLRSAESESGKIVFTKPVRVSIIAFSDHFEAEETETRVGSIGETAEEAFESLVENLADSYFFYSDSPDCKLTQGAQKLKRDLLSIVSKAVRKD